MKNKIEKMLTKINFSDQKGLEIGPLHNPIITKKMGNVRYIDHDTTECIRAKYSAQNWPVSEINKIVDIDYVWGAKGLKEITSGDEPYDYVIASHVIEHVPDLIGWLKEVRSVLKSGGILSLAIPDKRFTFDYYRRPTSMADLIEAYLKRAKKPTPFHIFEHYAEFDNTWLFSGEKSELKRDIKSYRVKKAWKIAETSHLNNQYVDVHCWTFTDTSFLSLLSDMVILDLLDFRVINFYESSGMEFIVGLEALNPEMALAEKEHLQMESIRVFQKHLTRRSFLRKIKNFKSWPFTRWVRTLRRLILINFK